MASYTEKEGYNKYLTTRSKIVDDLNFITWDAVSFKEYCKWRKNPYEYMKIQKENLLNGLR